MSGHDKPKTASHKYTTRAYATGFLLSLSLTLVAFFFVWRFTDSGDILFSKGFLTLWLVVLALTQLFTQLVFFLHLGRESNQRWNIWVLGFAAIIVLILVLGSLWIMSNLKYHGGHNPLPENINQTIIQDEGFHNH
ncbi:MAG TPA: cytochrome o ubiquinol oxidase subunit IV [Candidatus Saccharimonadales bacterium]|nr:cytochrome o ubiquinol oxidase subunit IV [Candidatus Saccharimonadales bacterium]